MSARELRQARTSTRSQMLALNCLIPFLVLFMLGWALIGQLVPPPSPAMSAEEIAEFFLADRDRYLACMVLCMISVSFLAPYSAAIIGQIARIEGEGPRVWTYTAVSASAGNLIAISFPMMFFMVVLFRVDRAPELVQLMSDFSWIVFIGTLSPFMAWPLSVAVVGFIDTSERPAFPRWYCYLTIALMIANLPTIALVFVQDGWFAWNSVFPWWVPFTDFFFWLVLTYWLVRRAIIAQAAEAELRWGDAA